MQQSSKLFRKTGSISLVGLSAFLFCGATNPQGCQTQNTNIGPSKGEVTAALVGTAAVIAVGTVVLVEVHKSHHTVKGCVSAGPDGVVVTTLSEKPKTFLLEGDVASVKVGDVVQFHGNKVRKTKDRSGDQTFQVQKIKKDFGHCKVSPDVPKS
jgi:hypothetical protein